MSGSGPAPWFHVADVPDAGSVTTLDDRETRHALGSRRLRPGEAVCLFDGRGEVGDATLVTVGGRRVEVRVEQRRTVEPPSPAVQLVCALPKGDRQSTLLSMATQLGMTSFAPLACRRAVARPGSGFADRTRRIFIEACKQSRRGHLPQLCEPTGPGDVTRPAWIADPGGEPVGPLLRVGPPSSLSIVIGPEGGLTDDELSAARDSEATPVSLGAGILRIETAAVSALAAVMLASTAD